MANVIYGICLSSNKYVKLITGTDPTEHISLEKLEEMNLEQWNYPLEELEHIIENDLDVVLVDFSTEDREVFRLCELNLEQILCELNLEQIASIEMKEFSYEVVLGPNTKQWWVYDNDADEYCDPPTEILERTTKCSKNTDIQQLYLKMIVSLEPEWLNDKDYRYDAEDTEI